MKHIDELLRSSKPIVPDLPTDFCDKAMLRIEKCSISIIETVSNTRLHHIRFVLGIASLFMAIILFGRNSYAVRINGSIELLYFGTRFLSDFIKYLPWGLILSSFALTALSIWMVNRSNLIKKGITVTAIACYMITGLGGIAMASMGVNERFEAIFEKKGKDWPWLSLLHYQQAEEFIQHADFKMGRVEKSTNGEVFVNTPRGIRMKIQLPANLRVREGQILRISGKGDNKRFLAQMVQICNPDRAMRYFSDMRHHQNMMKTCNCKQ